MNILSVARGHNGSTTLLVDGKVIFYLEEERLTRNKYDGAPLAGISKAFEYVDHIDHMIICHTHRDGPVLDWCGEDAYHGWARKLSKGKKFDYHYIDEYHHQLHAACGFYNSGFKTAACVIADGAGSFLRLREDEEWVQNTLMADATKSPIFEFETIFKVGYPSVFETVYKHVGTKEPIGMYQPMKDFYVTEYPGITKCYEAVTQYCGFPAIEAGKLMGLAPYGEPNEKLPKFFADDGWSNREVVIPTYPNAASINVNRFPILREDCDNWDTTKNDHTQIQKDMAYAIQDQTSKQIIKLIRKAHEETGEKNIVVCGGYGLNCVANYEYWKEFPDLNIYCEPISHDGGTSIGAAKMIYHQLTETDKPSKQESVYYGPQYDISTYEKSFGDLDVKDTSYDDIAQLIRDGNIVTIFQGRSEGGPRALGNRSILFDPTIKDGKDIVNGVKHREWFRPFACSILKEKVNDWFDLVGRDETPHMMYAVKCLDGIEEKIPSVIHVDGTCRIQTVTKEQNENYYNLISAFEKITEVPILFNTSFNLGGEPLVETIDDAINTLERSEIEYLYLPEIQKLINIPNPSEDIVEPCCENTTCSEET